MSSVASCLCVRNILRASLTDFYDGNDSLRKANCKIQPDDRPSPQAGEEFISIHGNEWSNAGDADYALHEVFGVTVAVTRRIGMVPFDRVGEIVYVKDEDIYVSQYKSLEDRLREINRLIHPSYVAQAAQWAELLEDRQLPYEKLSWTKTDSEPTIVGPSHFHADPSDSKYTGLVMRTYFRGAPRLHTPTTIDEVSA